MIELLFLSQTIQQDVAPQELPPIPGVSWECAVHIEGQPFRLSGHAPDFPSRRVAGRSMRTQVRSTGPDWSRGEFDINAEAASEDFRRYLLSRETPDGGAYLLDMVLLRGEMGISTLTDVSRPDRASPRANRLIAKGYCKSDFSPKQEGSSS
jgi:hypothetical protein